MAGSNCLTYNSVLTLVGSLILADLLDDCLVLISTNLLSLNSSNTEFLLIGLKNQLAKIHNSLLDTSHSARNLGFIFDEHLTFCNQITSLSKACYYHIHQLRCSAGEYLRYHKSI